MKRELEVMALVRRWRRTAEDAGVAMCLFGDALNDCATELEALAHAVDEGTEPEHTERCADGEPCPNDCPALQEEEGYWRAYFGLHPRMTRDERRAQLERMRPSSDEPQRGGSDG